MATLEEFMALCAASVFADESRPPAQDEKLQAAKRRLLLSKVRKMATKRAGAGGKP